ncbi:prepilin peptidase [Quadrisphaera sp. INWT6]|uniref:prepilin peptidase n=1 Tax=Quadrisphaera sp. INWT6 TaxID=2596917 RepID=UPI0019D63530|nr:prepilin peptidase [Quadrisphaera sp. INWT6]
MVSWLLLRGRCRSCAAPTSVRHPLVELATAGLFAAVTAWVAHEGRWALLPVLLHRAAAGLALALIDLDVHRLPDAIVLPAYPVTAVLGGLVGVALVATGVLRRRGHLPFGPFMLVGAALGVVAGGGVVHWYLAMSGYPLA